MKVKIKKLNYNAVIPEYSKPGDAGLDLTAISLNYDGYGNVVYGTGLAIEIPEGFVGLLFPRSSISQKNLHLTNCVGVLDSGYRGEIIFKFKTLTKTIVGFKYWFYRIILRSRGRLKIDVVNEFYGNDYDIGDRIGQLVIMPYPKIEFEKVDTLSQSERRDGGYGSTGK